jgi:hypothetical protein
MIRATRRAALGGALLGALAVPAVPAMVRRMRHGRPVMLHDSALAAGRRFAEAGRAQGLASFAIEGDRVRFMREILREEPSLVFGVSRHADAQLIEDIAREHGYVLAASMDAKRGRCLRGDAQPGWRPLVGFVGKAGEAWPEALACYAGQADRVASLQPSHWLRAAPDRGLVLGWALARRA